MNDLLVQLARRYVWWSPPESALADRRRFVAQVMALGTWEDAHALLRLLGPEAFLEVLRSPPPGVLSARSWWFWHRRLLHRDPATPVPPSRMLPDAAGKLRPEDGLPAAPDLIQGPAMTSKSD